MSTISRETYIICSQHTILLLLFIAYTVSTHNTYHILSTFRSIIHARRPTYFIATICFFILYCIVVDVQQYPTIHTSFSIILTIRLKRIFLYCQMYVYIVHILLDSIANRYSHYSIQRRKIFQEKNDDYRYLDTIAKSQEHLRQCETLNEG